MKKAIIIAGLLFLMQSGLVISGPSDLLWWRTYGGENWEEARSVEQTTDGGYIIAGWTMSYGCWPGMYEDVYLVKTNYRGDTTWTKTYGGMGEDRAYSVRQTRDRGFIICGITNAWIDNGLDVLLIKTDANGQVQWARNYGGPDHDRGRYAEQTSDGGYIVTGGSNSVSYCHRALLLMKTNANGDTSWTRFFGNEGKHFGHTVKQTSDGGYIVAGLSEPDEGCCRNLYLVKTDAQGNLQWERRYGGAFGEEGYGVLQTDDGGYIVCGSTQSWGAGNRDFYVVKTDVNGDSIWARTYGGSGNEYAWSIAKSDGGGYILAGSTESYGSGNYDFYVVKIDNSGNIKWASPYGGTWEDKARSIEQTRDGGYIVAGYNTTFGAGSLDFWLVKLAGEIRSDEITVDMIPHNAPVVVPRGSSFYFTGTLKNNTYKTQNFDLWVMVRDPNSNCMGPIELIRNLTFGPMESRTFPNVSQLVPYEAQRKTYSYISYIGKYPDKIYQSSIFDFTVIRAEAGRAQDWSLSGWIEENDSSGDLIPYTHLSNYPNPFNAATDIRYGLNKQSNVCLEIYNILGQKINTLVDEYQPAGEYSVSWDASACASGTYFYKFSAGGKISTGRMTLLK